MRAPKQSRRDGADDVHSKPDRSDTVCVCAFLRKQAARALDEQQGLEKQVAKCLYQFAVGALDVRARDGTVGPEFYARLDGKKRMQFVRTSKPPPDGTYCRVLRVHVPASLVKDSATGLHVSMIYTSDKGNKMYKQMRGAPS